MGAFAIGANAVAGIIAATEALDSRKSILLLLPILNILAGIIMLYRVREGKFEVTDENASPRAVILASVILLLVFGLVFLRFHATWAVTFSACMFYSTTLTFSITWLIGRFNLRLVNRERYHWNR